jgi:nicotinamide mononucleotide transporter
MNWQEIYQEFVTGLQQTSVLEFVAVVFGIASVLFSRKENILVYPTGIINTVLYTWFCFGWWGLYAEGSLNFYYTAMSIYGWYAWSQKSNGGEALHITPNNKKDWTISIGFFVVAWVVLFYILKTYTKSTVPLGDSFASATAYTGMWQMARKKIENWMWWTLTNLVSVPLYFSKGAVFTSVQYIVFLILAIIGWIEWHRKYYRKHA